MQSVNTTLVSTGTRYGHTRPCAIAAKIAALRAHCFRAPVALETAAPLETAPVAEVMATAPVAAETALPFVQRFPHLAAAHIQAQRRMFAAMKRADLPTAIELRLAGINALLGTAFTSSRALSPNELHAVADAIQAGRFAADWTLHTPVIDDGPELDAPPEIEAAPESVGNPAPLESLDEIAMEFDLAQMRAADRARLLNSLRSERVLLATKLAELDHAILTA